MLKGDVNNLRVNFLLGPGRCGTTLLMLMLNEHRNAISTPELKHLLYLYPKYKDIKEVSPDLKKEISRYFNEWFAAGKLNDGFKFKLNELLDSLKEGETTSYANISKKIYLAFDYKEKELDNITAIFDKNPYYTLSWNKLTEIYPETQFLVMLRDHRAYVNSNYSSTDFFSKRRSVYYYAMVWKFYVKKIDEIQKKMPGKNIFVNYENLILNTEKVLEDIYSFFRLLPDTAGALNYQNTVLEKVKSIDQGKLKEPIRKKISDLARPVYKESLTNWKSKMNERQIKICEFVCGNDAKRYGYEPIYQLTLTEKMIFALRSVPAYLRVSFIFSVRSIKLHHYFFITRNIKNKKRG